MALLIRDLLKIRKLAIGLTIFLSLIIISLIGPLVYPISIQETFLPERPPSRENILGTDNRGGDILAQLLAGIRGSLYIGVIAALIATVIGIIIGSIAAYRGGIVDLFLMSLTDTVLSIPTILLLILIAAYFKVRTPLLIAIMIGITAWPWLAKALRARLLSLREREFIYMSKIAGLSDVKIIVEDLLPNMGSYIFMAFIFMLNGAMLTETGLSMIGIGTTEGVTLGTMLFWAQMFDAVRRSMWWWFIPPGVTLVALTTSLLLINTALDEFFNPRLRE